MSKTAEKHDAPECAMRVQVRIELGSGHRIGPGKIDLLEAIGGTGSITGAGRRLGMSYRRAWLLVSALNQMFDAPVVETVAGGAHGGGAKLTSLGAGLVEAYRGIERGTEGMARERLREFATRVAPAATLSGSSASGVAPADGSPDADAADVP